MSKLLLCFILLAAFLVSGCQTAPIVHQSQTVLIAPDDRLIMDCKVIVPPNQEEYNALTIWVNKEAVLIKQINDHNVAMTKCNNQMKELRSWKVAQKKIYGDTP